MQDFAGQIEKELAAAVEALSAGNEGKARVCARRAAGRAITWYLEKNPGPNWGSDALSQITHLASDADFPREVRDAALRLTTKISDRFAYPFTTEPVNDARMIIDHIRKIVEDAATDGPNAANAN